MAIERPNPEANLQIGEMPTPRYMREAGDTTGDGNIRWIGMEAYAPDGQIKDFLWWRNFKVGDFSNERARYDAATFVARLKIEMGAESAIGPAIDLYGSNSETGHVKTVDEPEVYGVYVEADKRPMFNFMTAMRGVKDEAELRRANPVEFDALFQQAKAVLPRPNDTKASENKPNTEQALDQRIKFISGDLTEVEADAIVCPSLPDLDVLYTGVAGAIMRKGGDRIFEEARAIGTRAKKQNPQSEFPVSVHSAHLTNGGDLPKAKHVIHSVAVSFSKEDGLSCDQEAVFKSAWNVLEVAEANGLTSVAFPALGAGLYQMPLDQSLGAIAQAADRFLKEHPETKLQDIKLVSFDPRLPKPTLVEELIADQWARSLRSKKN